MQQPTNESNGDGIRREVAHLFYLANAQQQALVGLGLVDLVHRGVRLVHRGHFRHPVLGGRMGRTCAQSRAGEGLKTN